MAKSTVERQHVSGRLSVKEVLGLLADVADQQAECFCTSCLLIRTLSSTEAGQRLGLTVTETTPDESFVVSVPTDK